MPARPLYGTVSAVVESIKDPEQRGRIKARASSVYGPAEGAIATTDIPWALPAGLPAGGSPASGGIDWMPEVGDQVWLRFLDGEPEKPIWEWALQHKKQAQSFPFRNYKGDTPDKHALLTRYKHKIEIREDRVTISTSKKYFLELIDASEDAQDGSCTLETAKSYFLKLLDKDEQLSFFAKHIKGQFTDLTFTGETSAHNMSTRFDATTQLARLRAPRVELGTGANDAIIRRSDLENVVRQILIQHNTHIHPKTGTPVKPMRVRVTSSRNTFSV
jgi:Type VI secretion system/phage-baseplate injector OB domain